MIFKELKRIIFNAPAIMIIVMALLLSVIFSYVTVKRDVSENTNIYAKYEEYMEQLYGKVTKEKVEQVQREKKYIDDTLAVENEMLAKYDNGEISANDYQKYLNENFYASQHSGAIDLVSEKCLLLEKHLNKKTNVYFINDTFWNMYFKMEGITFLQMIVTMALIIRYLSGDYVSGMWRMTQTYYNGKTKLFNIRLCATIMANSIITFLYATVYFVFFKYLCGLSDMDAPIQSINDFVNFPISLSIGQFIIFLLVFRMIAFALLGIFTFSVTTISKNVIVAFGVCGFAVIIPFLFSNVIEKFRNFSFFEILLGTGIMRKNETFVAMLLNLFIFLLVVFIVYIITLYRQSDIRIKNIYNFRKRSINNINNKQGFGN